MEAGSDTSNGTNRGNRVNQLGSEKEKANAITFLSELLPEVAHMWGWSSHVNLNNQDNPLWSLYTQVSPFVAS